MILRRVIEHVRRQEWTAIWIDLVIVVVGVFIGIQVANWNAARGDRAEYELALGRLAAEIDANLATLEALDPDVERSLLNVNTAFDALQTCADTEANRKAVEIGLNELRGSYGLHLRKSALLELATSPRLLARQNAAERQRFADLLYYHDLAHSDAAFAETFPQGARIENNPMIGFGPPRKISPVYFGFDYSKTVRPLVLNGPIDAACKDNRLIKAFYVWERWEANLPVLTRKVRMELEATKALIGARR